MHSFLRWAIRVLVFPLRRSDGRRARPDASGQPVRGGRARSVRGHPVPAGARNRPAPTARGGRPCPSVENSRGRRSSRRVRGGLRRCCGSTCLTTSWFVLRSDAPGPRPAGYWLSGSIDGEVPSTLTLVVNGEIIAGTVRAAGRLYTIRAAGAGQVAIRQIDPSTLPGCAGVLSPPSVPAAPDRLRPIAPPSPARAAARSSGGPEDGIADRRSRCLRAWRERRARRVRAGADRPPGSRDQPGVRAERRRRPHQLGGGTRRGLRPSGVPRPRQIIAES